MDSAASYFKGLDDQSDVFETLNKMLQTGKIPNALLFTGNKGSRRKETGILFAASVNCAKTKTILLGDMDAPCLSCKKIFTGMHPDMLMIEPEKKVIKIKQIRALYASIATRPHEAKMRVVFIKDAHKMNSEAGNALLKILEEPPANTFFILMAPDLLHLLPTIVSRCRHIRFKPISCRTIEKRLVHEYSMEKRMAKIVAASSDGSLDKALMMLNLTESSHIDWLKRRQWLLANLSAILLVSNNTGLKKEIYALMLAAKIAETPEILQETLAIAKGFIRDLSIIRFNPEQVINVDATDRLQNIIKTIPLKTSIAWLYLFSELEEKLQSNAVIRLLLEQFFLKLVSGVSADVEKG